MSRAPWLITTTKWAPRRIATKKCHEAYDELQQRMSCELQTSWNKKNLEKPNPCETIKHFAIPSLNSSRIKTVNHIELATPTRVARISGILSYCHINTQPCDGLSPQISGAEDACPIENRSRSRRLPRDLTLTWPLSTLRHHLQPQPCE